MAVTSSNVTDCATSSKSPAIDEFLLHGRTADLVNVAGKRSSFGYLNAQLNAIPGVLDGVFFLREPRAAGA